MTHTTQEWLNHMLAGDFKTPEQAREALPETTEEREARLIAAAPELLEALKELLFRVNRNDRWLNVLNISEAKMRQSIVNKARAAIAKAEGK